ncbi:hypothetical protein EJ02DRAFT_49134 [Clathrospora elynae]|uniref:FHA domain-containing protein n=1 Tax=Clathrospora elynae TaxID=706981 RepID=A0A6A5SGM7_9PLEO|nr:hypothetical protein EJ02DRAFT_49134 [Clathrospora elynae]
MDPLSVTVSCVALVTAASKVSYSLTNFTREWRDASGDLGAISRELLSFQVVLENLIKDTVGSKESALPPNLRLQIIGILMNCNRVVDDIEASLNRHAQSRLGKGGYWTFGGKDEMAKHRSSLEAHKSALEIALEMVAISITRDIKSDTTRILEEIERLRKRLPLDHVQTDRASPTRRLKKYLDDMSCYAEISYNPSDDEEGNDDAYMSAEDDYYTHLEAHHHCTCYESCRRLGTYDGRLTPDWSISSSTPFIQLSPDYDDPSDFSSLDFDTITRYLPDTCTVVRVGRYSDNRGPERNYVGFKSKVVSRTHCEIWRKDGKWYIKDLKSSSGTWLNSNRLSGAGKTSKPHRLRNGDVVQLGADYKGGYDFQGKNSFFRRVRMVVSLSGN